MLHLGAVLPNLTFAADAHYHHLADDIIEGGKMPYADGAIAVPTGPGLGVQLDRDKVAALRRALPGARRLPVRPGPGPARLVPAGPQRPVGRPRRRRREPRTGVRGCTRLSAAPSAVVLENEVLRVTVLLDGGHVVEFNHKPRDLDHVWLAPDAFPRPGPDFLDSYPGGWQEVLPNGGAPAGTGAPSSASTPRWPTCAGTPRWSRTTRPGSRSG